jgi:hypothetical protein
MKIVSDLKSLQLPAMHEAYPVGKSKDSLSPRFQQRTSMPSRTRVPSSSLRRVDGVGLLSKQVKSCKLKGLRFTIWR